MSFQEENAHTALTVLLVAALESFGPASVALKQFFPVLDAIKERIDGSDLESCVGLRSAIKSR